MRAPTWHTKVATPGRFYEKSQAQAWDFAWYSYPYMRLAWLFVALASSALLASLQHWALAAYLYWYYPWFDTMMHFLGGITVAAFGIALLDSRRALVFLAAMLGIAIGWELFELSINAEREANFAFDTSLDLLMDAVGMSFAYLFARYTIWRSA